MFGAKYSDLVEHPILLVVLRHGRDSTNEINLDLLLLRRGIGQNQILTRIIKES